MRPFRRAIKRAAIALLAASLITLAISWAIALWLPWPDPAMLESESDRHWQFRPPAAWPAFPSGAEVTRAVGREKSQRAAAYPDGRLLEMVTYSTGWPFTALTNVETYEFAPANLTILQKETHFQLEAPEWMAGEQSWGTLPLRPRWPGFAINSASYAALILLLQHTAERHIRRRRQRANRCPTCGYSTTGLTTIVCPECGNRLTAGC